MQIQAAVLRSNNGPHTVEDVDLAEPAAGEMRVRITGAGMCHTDLLPRDPGFMAQPPIVLGHEGSGVVEAVGPGVDSVRVGDHVVLSYDSCRICRNCRSAHTAYCETFFPRNLDGVGLAASPIHDATGEPIASRWFGQSSFATHSLVTERNVVAVDPDLPLELLGPLGCGIQTGAGSVLVAMGVTAGSSIVVFGAGGVGLSAVMAARVAGATTIVAVDLHSSRLELARELGATHTLQADEADLLSALRETTGGGADYSFDTTGMPSVIGQAVHALRPSGVCGLVGVQQGDIVLDPMALSVGRTVMGILEGDAVPQVLIPRLIDLWRQGRFPFDRLVETFPLSRINEAEQASMAGKVVKPVLLPGS
ncbi:MAG: NAD(P)-dependent alcohol dehydrogenase [Pseudonocardia sp.]|nr:NAD(P)-dependent alcohol dehydrogenase [Pseudonocardia sp.]